MAQEIGATPAQVALSWVRQQPGTLIPLVGARTVEQLQDNLGCLDVTLTDEQIATLNASSQIDLGFPHSFLASDGIRDVVFGGTYNLIDAQRR
jgi:diketogulonate reductase-like aldo/keto reductase